MMRKIYQASPAESNRRTEVWFRRGLWLLAVIFAWFLIGLSGKIVDDLPKVAQERPLTSYLDQSRFQALNHEKESLDSELKTQQDKLEQAKLAYEKQQNETASAQESFQHWLAARHITQQSQQNPEVLKRTHELDRLVAKERDLQRQVEAIQQSRLDTEQRLNQVQHSIDQLENTARPAMEHDRRITELKVFLYRLALTLPLLLMAIWLFKTKRHSRWFPFVWGFIWFALFAFFVELVPYLPSYGGYVRYIVGIGMTVVVGRYAIMAMHRYLERKQQEETLPSTERQQQVHYDLALNRLAKGICPACERPLDFSNAEMDYCPHCSIHLFKVCPNCQTRTSAFNRYCYRCGTAR